MRILLLSHGLPPHSVGGVEQHVDGLARALAALGHDVHVWSKSGDPGPTQGSLRTATPDDRRPYTVTRAVYRYEGLESLQDLYRVDRLDRAFDDFLARSEPFDVAHVHHLTGLSTGLVRVLEKHGVRRVLTLHDYWLMCPRGQMWHREGSACERVEPSRCADCLRPNWGGWVPDGTAGDAVLQDVQDHAREILAAADSLVVPSARAIPPFVELGIDAGRFHVVENGVDIEGLKKVPDPVLESGRPIRIGYLGTLIPSKGLDVLIDAFRRLPPGRARLEVYGNAVPYHGDDGFLTRAFSMLTPGMPFRYHGPYRTQALARILENVDVVAAPALWHEAFGLTVREALAAGRGILVSRIGGLQDAVRDPAAGRVLPPGDVDAWAGALDEISARPETVRSMARAARAIPTRGFEEMADELVGIYQGAPATA